MTTANDRNTDAHSSGLAGTIKLIAAGALIALGCLTALFVFDLIPRELLTDVLGKTVAIFGIVAVVTVGIGVLLRSR